MIEDIGRLAELFKQDFEDNLESIEYFEKLLFSPLLNQEEERNAVIDILKWFYNERDYNGRKANRYRAFYQALKTNQGSITWR